ncbi:hypothetical protein Tco_1445440, partial [Tanacetum coccineum]
MVTYLEKSIEHADFDEIVDFLNANHIRYALTVSLTIYVSYIEQFWSTAKIKIVNNERQIRTKVNGKKIVISESSVRIDLQFNDEDASHTKKVFENMRRQGKDFSGTVTPLFTTMLIQPQADVGEEQDSGNIIRTQSMSTLNEPIPQRTGLGVNTPGSGEDRLKITELMEIYTKLSDRVLALENVKTAQDLEITSLKKREDVSKQGRNEDQDEDTSWFQEDVETQGSTAKPSTPPTTTTVIEDEDLIIVQILMKMRSEKSKEKAKERGSKEKSSELA